MIPTSQQGLNEDSTLDLQLPVEMAKDGPHHAKHNLEVCLLQCRLTCGVQQVLQLGDQQLAHPHQQRMLKSWYGPAVSASSLHRATVGSLCCALFMLAGLLEEGRIGSLSSPTILAGLHA